MYLYTRTQEKKTAKLLYTRIIRLEVRSPYSENYNIIHVYIYFFIVIVLNVGVNSTSFNRLSRLYRQIVLIHFEFKFCKIVLPLGLPQKSEVLPLPSWTSTDGGVYKKKLVFK